MRVMLLGPVQVQGPGGFAALPARERALLVRLALDGGRVVSVDRLIDDLWGDDPPDGARNTLQVYVSHLRRALGREAVASSGGGYALQVSAESVDALRFGELVSTGSSWFTEGDHAQAKSALEEALTLWGGQPLAELRDYGFARLEAGRLTELRAAAVETLAEVELARGGHDRVVTEFGPLVQEFPFHERLRAAVITGLYQQGRAAAALELYREGQDLLREELGLDPGPRLRALQAAILADDPALAAQPRRQRVVGGHPAPAPATALLGREDEVADVSAILDRQSVRLVTVMGPGGAGKTRLAMEVANNPPARFAEATIWVSLDGVDDVALTLPAVATALNLQAPQIQVPQIAAVVSSGPTLLLLDNVEHLLPGVRNVVRDLLAGCPTLTILVTSRAAMHVAGETRFELGSLALPAQDRIAAGDLDSVRDSPAVRLFAARAAEVKPGFAVDEKSAAVVGAICVRLDGLPLALELAASRVAVLDVGAILERLHTRLSLLTTGTADVRDRHRSLRATLDWSHRLLSPPAAALFAMLAVFRGGFTFEAAESLAHLTGAMRSDGDAGGATFVDAFQELRDASLVSRDERASARFVMLDTIGEYAVEKITECGRERAFRDAHCEYFRIAAAGRWASLPLWPRTVEEADWYRIEQDNLRTAIQWAEQRDDGPALADLATATAGHWESTGQWADAARWLTRVAKDERVGVRRFDSAYWLAITASERDSLEESKAQLERANRLLGDRTAHPGRAAVASAHQGLLAHLTGDDAEAAASSAVAVVAAADTADLDVRSRALSIAAAGRFDDWEFARELLLEALDLARRAANANLQLSTLNNLAVLAATAGRYESGLRWCSEALRLPIADRQPGDKVYVLTNMVELLLLTGDIARARATAPEALALAVRTDLKILLAECALHTAILRAVAADETSAAVLLGFHDELLRLMGQRRIDAEVLLHERYLAGLVDRMDPGVHASCLERGARLTVDEFVDWVLGGKPPDLETARAADGSMPA